MMDERSFKHDLYSVITHRGWLAERIVLNFGEDFTTPAGALVISQIRVGAVCGAIEVYLTDTYELKTVFVLSDGFDRRKWIEYNLPSTLLTDLSYQETGRLMDLHACHLATSFDISVDMGPVLHDTNGHNHALKRTTNMLAAQWLARYLAFNYKISVEVKVAEGKTLADSSADISFSLPCYKGIGVCFGDCEVEEGNGVADRAKFLVIK